MTLLSPGHPDDGPGFAPVTRSWPSGRINSPVSGRITSLIAVLPARKNTALFAMEENITWSVRHGVLFSDQFSLFQKFVFGIQVFVVPPLHEDKAITKRLKYFLYYV